MTKVVPLNAKWDAVAALNCAIEETDPDEQVIVIVRKKDGDRCRYAANMTNMEVHWECSLLASDVVNNRIDR